MFWSAPASTGGGLNGYEVQRASDPAGPFTDLAFVNVTDPRQYLDPASSGETWTYRIEAVNDAGTSAPSGTKTGTIPAPVSAGSNDGLVLDPSDPNAIGAGGVAFGATELTVSSISPDFFVLHGVTLASSPQGPRDISLNIGSILGNPGSGTRPVAGNTYSTASNFGANVMYAPNFVCNGTTGTAHVDEASFKADGTPLVFAATYSLCGGGQAVVRWNANSGVGPAMTAAPAPYDFGSVAVGGQATKTFVLANGGEGDETLGTAAVTDSVGAPTTSFSLGADQCSGVTLAPGGSCTVDVSGSPSTGGSANGLLVVPDGTTNGKRSVGLSVYGVVKPDAPTLSTTSSFGAVRLYWNYSGGNGQNGGYTVYRGAAADSLSVLAQLPASQSTSPSYVDSTAVPGTTYYYAVSATNLAGEGPQSTAVTGVASDRGVLFSTDEWSGGGTDYQIGVVTNGIRTQLTFDSGDHDTPASSPDGTAFAYTSNHGNAAGDYDLWVKSLSGSPVRLATGTTTSDAEPSWSPDGKSIAFTRYPVAGGAPSVWLVPAAGGTPTQVPGTTGESSPSWSPNGHLLVVSHSTTSGSYLVVMNLAGTYRRVVAGTQVANADAYSPSWSPDGTSIAFVRASGVSSWVSSVPAGGGTVSDLTDGFSDVLDLSWSPSGDRIVFEAYENGIGGSLWSVGPTGSNPSPGPISGASSYDQTYPSAIEPRAVYSPIAAPSPATAVAAVLGSGSVTLSWTKPANAAYVVVRRSAAGGSAPSTVTDGVGVYSGSASSAVATGLSNGARYAFSVFTVSALGDVGAAVTRTIQPAAVPVTSPNSVATVLSGLYAGGPRFTARWGAALPAGQVYDVQLGTRRLSGSVWSAPVYSTLSTGTATSKVVTAAAGVTYYLRARVRDAAGDVTAWSAPSVAAVPYDDRQLTAAGSWTAASAAGHFMSTVRIAKAAGASLTLRTYGSRFTLVGDVCSTCGYVRVYVDGVLKATVSTYSSASGIKRALWQLAYSSIGLHTVRITVVGTAGHPYAKIDGLAAQR